MKIGFFGGSFNPPTNAHVNLAKKAIDKCKLDKIIFVPMGDLYKKENLAKAEERYNMLKIVCLKEKKLEVTDIELKIDKNLTTIEAFRLIEKTYPNDDKYFLMGADNFIKILNWEESKELINKYKYIVFEREDINLKKYINENLKNQNISIFIVKNYEHKTASSSKFRNRQEKELIPIEVLKYIEKNKIY